MRPLHRILLTQTFPGALNPWVGVALIAIGVGADVILTLTHNQVSSLVVSVVVAGLGLVQAFAHARSRSNGVPPPPRLPPREHTNGTGGFHP